MHFSRNAINVYENVKKMFPDTSTLLLPLSLTSKTLPSPRTSPAPLALPPTLPFLTPSTADTSQSAVLLPNYSSATHPNVWRQTPPIGPDAMDWLNPVLLNTKIIKFTIISFNDYSVIYYV